LVLETPAAIVKLDPTPVLEVPRLKSTWPVFPFEEVPVENTRSPESWEASPEAMVMVPETPLVDFPETIEESPLPS